jgi:hypothetical protein
MSVDADLRNIPKVMIMNNVHSPTVEHMKSSMKEDHEALVVQIYDNFEAIAEWQKDWDSFMEEMNAEIFLTYDWCKIWWKYYGKGRELKIFVFRKNDQIMGILPLFHEVIGLWPVNLSVIKIVGTDFMPITINIPLRTDQIDEIVNSLISNLNKVCRWDLM